MTTDPVTVTVLAGLPGSGKTTIARKCGMRFNLDDTRAMLGITRGNWSREREDVAIQMMIAGAKAAIVAGMDIVLDNTHVAPRLPRMYRKELGPLGVEFAVIDLTAVPIEECIARDAGAPSRWAKPLSGRWRRRWKSPVRGSGGLRRRG